MFTWPGSGTQEKLSRIVLQNATNLELQVWHLQEILRRLRGASSRSQTVGWVKFLWLPTPRFWPFSDLSSAFLDIPNSVPTHISQMGSCQKSETLVYTKMGSPSLWLQWFYKGSRGATPIFNNFPRATRWLGFGSSSTTRWSPTTRLDS